MGSAVRGPRHRQRPRRRVHRPRRDVRRRPEGEAAGVLGGHRVVDSGRPGRGNRGRERDRRARSRHVGRSALSGATTPNLKGLVPPVAVESVIVPVLVGVGMEFRCWTHCGRPRPRSAISLSTSALGGASPLLRTRIPRSDIAFREILARIVRDAGPQRSDSAPRCGTTSCAPGADDLWAQMDNGHPDSSSAHAAGRLLVPMSGGERPAGCGCRLLTPMKTSLCGRFAAFWRVRRRKLLFWASENEWNHRPCEGGRRHSYSGMDVWRML